MKFDKLLRFLMVLLPLLALAACGGGGGGGSSQELRSIVVSPGTRTLAAGTVQQFTATAAYSDGTTRDVTATATWSSSSTAVTVSNAAGSKGSVTALSAGTAKITATVGGVSGSATVTVSGSGGTAGANVMTISVNGSLCSAATSGSYFNKPCVSVTICTPGTSTCQTVNDILLDTGSYGLRIFKSAIPNLPLPQIASGAGLLTGCVEFADGSSLWGPIRRAAVKLGNEPAVEVPIQLIDAGFSSSSGTRCAVQGNSPYLGPDRNPAEAGFTGMLGIGVANYDCGLTCVNHPIGVYYSCTGAGCTTTTVPLSDQVANPVAALPSDNNGFIVQLPAVPAGGVTSTSGTLLLGIGTQSNNSPGSVTVLPTDATGNFITVFNGQTLRQSFLDTGSNAYFIPPSVAPSNWPRWSSDDSAWYVPADTVRATATAKGAGGTPSRPVNFTVSDARDLFSSPNRVFSDIAGTSTFGFDWGLPFFMGRRVVYGLEGSVTPSLGIGPFVGF